MPEQSQRLHTPDADAVDEVTDATAPPPPVSRRRRSASDVAKVDKLDQVEGRIEPKTSKDTDSCSSPLGLPLPSSHPHAGELPPFLRGFGVAIAAIGAVGALGSIAGLAMAMLAGAGQPTLALLGAGVAITLAAVRYGLSAYGGERKGVIGLSVIAGLLYFFLYQVLQVDVGQGILGMALTLCLFAPPIVAGLGAWEELA